MESCAAVGNRRCSSADSSQSRLTFGRGAWWRLCCSAGRTVCREVRSKQRLALLARQTNSGAFEFFSDFRHFAGIGLGLGTLLPFLQGQLPLRDRFFDLALLQVYISQVIVDRGIAVDLLDRLAKILLGLVEPVKAEVDPAQAVEIRPVVRLELQ